MIISLYFGNWFSIAPILDESIFEHCEEDEIILCLNYDGLYGINNINRFLQSSNPNESVVWGINTYKVGDPILFNESNIFSPLIHNNSKGKSIITFSVNKYRSTDEDDTSLTMTDKKLKYSFNGYQTPYQACIV